MRKINIHNIRLGMATNSSSSHSLVFIKSGVKLQDHDCDGDFGWQNFIAASPESKRHYMMLTLYHNLRHSFGSSNDGALLAAAVMSELLGDDNIILDAVDNVKDGSIDHQSMMELPVTRAGQVDLAFMRDMMHFMQRDDIAILGGNDNDEDHPLLHTEDVIPFHFLPLESSAPRSRYSGLGYWTLFNKSSGAKIRLSFDYPTSSVQCDRSLTPELVDLKITSMCPFANNETCGKWCYQAATVDGQHASIESINKTIKLLADMDVLEVAIGGGEPTIHPNFVDIMISIRANGIIPNFTTRSLKWLNKQDDNTSCIIEAMGSFAYSVDNAEDVKKLVTILNKKELRSALYEKHVAVQHVLGTSSIDELKTLLDIALKNHINVTLLGHKNVGRGDTATLYDVSEWINVVKTALNDTKTDSSILIESPAIATNPFAKTNQERCAYSAHVGIDTCIVQQYREQLLAAGLHESLFTLKEGSFSMYIDAVKMQMGPSSYCDQKHMSQMPITDNLIDLDACTKTYQTYIDI